MEQSFTIRKATHSDANNIITAHRRSIREVCSKDYSTEQVTSWSGRNFQADRWIVTRIWKATHRNDADGMPQAQGAYSHAFFY